METDDLNIEAHLAYSEKLYGLTTGHQQETTQLLEDIGQLQTYVRLLLAENRKLRQENADKDTLLLAKDNDIAELKQRIADLQKPTAVTSVAGDYYENMHIERQIFTTSLPPIKKRKNRITTDKNQLPLWQTL